MTEPKAIESGSIAAGLTTKVPQLIVHQGALLLRQLLDAGVQPDDPRCASLLQIVNSARLSILPDSNNGAGTASDLTSRAIHIDISTATMAAIMGLKNAHLLTGAAVSEASIARHRQLSASTNPSSLKIKLLPKLSFQAFNALVHLIRTDVELGQRAHKETLLKTNSMAQKMNRLRAGQRHAVLRKRRLTGESIADLDENRDEVPPPIPRAAPAIPITTLTNPSINNFPTATATTRHINVNASVPNQATLLPPMPISSPTPIAPRPHKAPAMALTRASFQAELRPQVTPQIPHQDPVQQSFARYRTRHVPPPERADKRHHQAIAKDKGVMNDTIGTSDEVMEAFIQPGNMAIEALHEALDNPTKVRTVLAERERVLYRLLKRRRSELAAMPLGMTEQTRRNAIIEAKQLSLLDLQRVVRYRVCTENKKMLSLSVQDRVTVPPDNLSRLFRRRDPPIYSYTDGYPRITRFDGITDIPPRHTHTVARDSVRMAQFDLSRMMSQKLQQRKEFHLKLFNHYVNFKNATLEARNARTRIWKGIERHQLEKKRAEERKRKMERIERLRLLRSNDEQAYLQMLKNTKNERLLQLVRQTDSYLMRLGAQVEKERYVVDGPATVDNSAHNAFNQELKDANAVPLDAMRRRRDLYYTVTHAVQEEVKQPSIMVHGTLKPYQLDGLKWMVSLYNNNLNGILADEMGLGKTIQTIALVTYLVERKNNPGPYMIIVPLSTMGNWVRELDIWAPSLTKIIYRGSKATRRNIQQIEMAARDFNILLTTYEFTVRDQQVLSRIPWKYIIIDEGHRMKNANCKLAMTLGVKYRSRNRLLLTGTPLQNDLTELWALLNFLLPTIFASSDTFETWFKQPFESTSLGDTAELEEEETLLVINRLHQVLRPFLLRRLKSDVETQLPSKVEHVIHCDMSSWQRVIYRQVKSRIGVATGTNRGGARSFNNLLMQCKKICNHPYLFYDQESIDFLPKDARIKASGKFSLLQHMLPKLQLDGHRTLIFSQMTAALDYLEYFLADIGIQYLRLDGNTRADDRQNLLNMFNAKDSPYFCFLLSTRAGGLGLNLQTADTVIIFDSDWNPMMDLQAQDRAHRIGQTSVVRVYRLICPGTVEEKILEQANKKLQIDAQVIQAGQFNNKSTEMDRHTMLKDLLRQKNDDDRIGDVPSMDELNRLFSRSEGEYEKFVEYDKKSREDGSFKEIFTREDQLPDWVLQPEIDHKTAEEKEKEILLSHGRGRRKRRQTHDMDMLTEAEWFKVVEGDMTVEEAFERRARRKERRRGNHPKAEDASTETEEDSDKGDQTEDEIDEPNKTGDDPEFAPNGPSAVSDGDSQPTDLAGKEQEAVKIEENGLNPTDKEAGAEVEVEVEAEAEAEVEVEVEAEAEAEVEVEVEAEAEAEVEAEVEAEAEAEVEAEVDDMKEEEVLTDQKSEKAPNSKATPGRRPPRKRKRKSIFSTRKPGARKTATPKKEGPVLLTLRLKAPHPSAEGEDEEDLPISFVQKRKRARDGKEEVCDSDIASPNRAKKPRHEALNGDTVAADSASSRRTSTSTRTPNGKRGRKRRRPIDGTPNSRRGSDIAGDNDVHANGVGTPPQNGRHVESSDTPGRVSTPKRRKLIVTIRKAEISARENGVADGAKESSDIDSVKGGDSQAVSIPDPSPKKRRRRGRANGSMGQTTAEHS